jgi:subtilisin family serine protease
MSTTRSPLQRRIVGHAACLMLGVFMAMTPARARQGNDFVPHELVCSVNPGASIDSINARYGTSTKAYIDTGMVAYFAYLLAVPANLAEDSLADVISLDADVLYCSPNYLLDAPEPVQRSQPFLDVTGSTEVTTQTAATRLHLTSAQAQSTGTGVQVAVIDVGVDATQPMLDGAVLSGIDYIDSDTTAFDEPGGAASGHGTFVAGVIHLVAPDAAIIPYRVIDTAGRGDGFSITGAILDAVDRDCKVINISLVMTGKHPSLDMAIEYARNRNVLVVAAAGNDSSSSPRFPADDSYCLGVAALDSADLKPDFSNFGSHIDLCAPGTNIKGPFPDSLYARWSGTSFAAPFVAGSAAMLYALKPASTWDEIVDQLTGTAQNVDPLNPAFAGQLGSGMVNPAAAVVAWWAAPGDVNASGTITGADIIYLVNFVFKSGVPPVSLNLGDVDATCAINAADIIYLVNYVYREGPAPVPGCVN